MAEKSEIHEEDESNVANERALEEARGSSSIPLCHVSPQDISPFWVQRRRKHRKALSATIIPISSYKDASISSLDKKITKLKEETFSSQRSQV